MDNVVMLRAVVTEEHISIGDKFLMRIIEALDNAPEIQAYSVQSRSYGDTESIEVRVNDKVTIQVTMTSSK
jgi:hypothetical protein